MTDSISSKTTIILCRFERTLYIDYSPQIKYKETAKESQSIQFRKKNTLIIGKVI